MFITLDGLSGGLTANTAFEADSLAVALLSAGFGVRINGVRINNYYGPGYQFAVWGEGDHLGESIDPDCNACIG